VAAVEVLAQRRQGCGRRFDEGDVRGAPAEGFDTERPAAANRSRIVLDSMLMRLARLLNRAPFTLSAVGRTVRPRPAVSRRPRALPAITRMAGT